MDQISSSLNSIDVAAENARFMSRVYRWMAGGVALSGAVAWYIGNDAELAMKIVGNPMIFWALVIAQIGAVLTLTVAAKRMSAVTMTMTYLAYAALTGTTLSVIFMIYTRESIGQVFGLTAFSFAGLSAFGAITKKDLSAVGSFCTMGLFGMIGFMLMGWIFPSMVTETSSKVYSIVGVLVFAGLTAWDTQKIKATNIIGNEGTEEDQKEAVFGALILYLDFVNLFLSLLRLTGRRR